MAHADRRSPWGAKPFGLAPQRATEGEYRLRDERASLLGCLAVCDPIADRISVKHRQIQAMADRRHNLPTGLSRKGVSRRDCIWSCPRRMPIQLRTDLMGWKDAAGAQIKLVRSHFNLDLS